MTQADPRLPAAADLYGDLLETPPSTLGWRAHVPGLIVTALAALAAAYLSDHYGAPLMLMGLLVGLALNFLSADVKLAPGLAFASRTLLRVGIVLVGLKITLGQIVDLGPEALLTLAAIVAATIAAGAGLSRLLGYGGAFGTLAGGAVAICGASAALAFAAVLGDRRIDRAQLALVLVGIATMSAFAMFAYPILAHAVGLSEHQAGFFVGASIHDVAQALGAGYAIGPDAGETAAITKLTRVAMLAPALAIVALFFKADGEGKGAGVGLPWFVVGFFAMAALNSTGWVPARAGDWAATGTSALLVCAVTATGIRSPMQELLRHGPKPLMVVAGATLVALLLSLLVAATLI